jgi:L-seryl-tRNA(Ser) seleniumtransferase
MLVLGALARDREVLVSRGELVEIGGSFRIPDIMEQSGARMVEVGTTNRTGVKDYEKALTEKTALIAKVHPSNYLVTGFTKSARISELMPLAREHGIPVYQDQGTGLVFGLKDVLSAEAMGTYDEPTVPELIAEGCDLVSFSGDKLLGGPQTGLIVGKRELIERLKSHPLTRAFRLDKLSLAALEATLQVCLYAQSAPEKLPTLRMLGLTLEELQPCAQRLQASLEKGLEAREAAIELSREVSCAGGGSLPALELPTWTVTLSQVKGGVEDLSQWLASECAKPVIARIRDGRLLLDVRTILDNGELDEVAQAIITYFSARRV